MLETLALSESGFLFDAKTGYTYSLNRTGKLLLAELIRGTAPETLAARLEEEFEVERPVAERDVEQFLFRLKDLQLVPGREELS